MTFGERVRQLRQSRGMTLRDVSQVVGVGSTYLCKVENGRLDFGEYPSDVLIHRLAVAFETDEEELTVLAERVPERIRKRVIERPDVFGAIADCDDATLDRLLKSIGGKSRCRSARRRVS